MKKRNELKKLRQEKLNGMFVRSRSKWIDEGEKPSKYFLRLENRHFSSKYMSHLQKDANTKTNTEEEKVEVAKSFQDLLVKSSLLSG